MPKTLGLVADPVVVAETVERTGPDLAARLSGDWHVRTDEQEFPPPVRNCANSRNELTNTAVIGA